MLVFAILYRFLYKLHHTLCLRPGKPLQKSHLVVVGSYRMGGAGKTPVTIELAKRYMLQGKSVAILLHKVAFDEELLVQRKIRLPRNSSIDFSDAGSHTSFGNAVNTAASVNAIDLKTVVVRTGNRYKTAHELDGKFDIILCDDGFEDSRLQPDETILLDWGEPCEKIRDLWPCGKCRSLKRDHINVTSVLRVGLDIAFSVESIAPWERWNNGDFEIASIDSSIVVVSGLGDPKRFFSDVENYLNKSQVSALVIKKIARPDHDKNFELYLRHLFCKYPKAAVIISEKDACRLDFSKKGLDRVFVALQSVKFLS